MLTKLCLCLGVFVTLALLTPANTANTCWGPWINTTTPSAKNNWTDVESLPTNEERAKLCPKGDASFAIQCKDDKDEPFTGFDPAASEHTVACNITSGLICTPNTGTNAHCPDFSVQYGCDCIPTTTGLPGRTNGPAVNPAKTSSQTTSTRSPSKTSTVGSPGPDNGGSKQSFNAVMNAALVLCAVISSVW